MPRRVLGVFGQHQRGRGRYALGERCGLLRQTRHGYWRSAASRDMTPRADRLQVERLRAACTAERARELSARSAAAARRRALQRSTARAAARTREVANAPLVARASRSGRASGHPGVRPPYEAPGASSAVEVHSWLHDADERTPQSARGLWVARAGEAVIAQAARLRKPLVRQGAAWLGPIANVADAWPEALAFAYDQDRATEALRDRRAPPRGRFFDWRQSQKRWSDGLSIAERAGVEWWTSTGYRVMVDVELATSLFSASEDRTAAAKARAWSDREIEMQVGLRAHAAAAAPARAAVARALGIPGADVPMRAVMRRVVDVVGVAVAAAPLAPFTLWLFRGLELSSSVSDALAAYTGRALVFTTPQSFTWDLAVGMGFGATTLLVMRVPAGSVPVASLDALGDNTLEHEMLVPPRTRFIVRAAHRGARVADPSPWGAWLAERLMDIDVIELEALAPGDPRVRALALDDAELARLPALPPYFLPVRASAPRAASRVVPPPRALAPDPAPAPAAASARGRGRAHARSAGLSATNSIAR